MAAPTNPKILIIGAGMSGILVAMRLLKAGFTDFRIYEKDHDLGGTWRINTYPGIACDVPSHYYTYENEPNSNWSAVAACFTTRLTPTLPGSSASPAMRFIRRAGTMMSI